MAWYIGRRTVTPMYGFCLPGAGLMSEPHDFRLERLSNRDGMRAGRFSDIVHVSSSVAGSSYARMSQAAYLALIDAVFMAPGVVQWLAGLRRIVEERYAEKEPAPAGREATPRSGLRLWRPS